MYYIGVDLGGTNIAVGIVSGDGEILYKDSILTLRERSYVEIIKDLASQCVKIVKDSNIEISQIRSIGIGTPGICNNDNGIIEYANNLPFNDIPIRDEIQKYINMPVFVENDANCAALGEYAGGAAKGFKNSITVTLGTGVGGGIVMDGKIFSSSLNGAGEVGHHIIVADGEECTCGAKGCWEVYASATALIRQTKIAIVKNPHSKLANFVDGDLKMVTAKTAFDAAMDGDAVAENVIDTYLQYVSIGISNLINILQPEALVIGGGVCAQGDTILNPIKEKVMSMIYGSQLKTKLMIAKLGNDAGIVGAAMLGK